MRIKSVSLLSDLTISQLGLTTIPINWYIDKDCYIETSLSSGLTQDGLKLYDSYKLSFSDYNKLINAEIDKIYAYINAKVKALSDHMDEISNILSSKLDEQDNVITSFISSMNDLFVHKVREYKYTLGGITTTCRFDKEDIAGTKIFNDDVYISGGNSLLCCTQVIEGTARKALWG